MAKVEPPYGFIASGLKAGEVVPFFRAAASAVYRVAGKPFLPFGGELALILAKAANYPATEAVHKAALSDVLQTVQQVADVGPEHAEAALAPVLRKHVDRPPGLPIVASWAEHRQGHRRAVERTLREAFTIECEPGLLHVKLAAVEGTQLYVTTNYDDLLEKALAPRQPHVTTTEPAVKQGYARLVQGLGPRAGTSVMTGPLLKALARTNDPVTIDVLAEALHSIGTQLTAEQAHAALVVLTQSQPNDQYLATLVEILKYPMAGRAPTHVLMQALRERFPELESGLAAAVTWFERRLGKDVVTRPPKQPAALGKVDAPI